ncbi:MAG TPA: hypothetical protein PKA26_00400 [bacterium]|nr:hypothetical protein [bacterium]
MIFLLFFIFLAVQSAATQDTLPEFPVHFVVIDGSEEVAAVATLEQMHREIEILNTYFVTEDKRTLVRFRFKSATFFDEIENTACSFVDSANEGMYIGRWANLYKECADTKLRDQRLTLLFLILTRMPKVGGRDEAAVQPMPAFRWCLLIIRRSATKVRWKSMRWDTRLV